VQKIEIHGEITPDRPLLVVALQDAPVPEQARLDVVAGEFGAQQGVVQQVDLAHREVVRGPEPGVDLLYRVIGQVPV